jgi:transposase
MSGRAWLWASGLVERIFAWLNRNRRLAKDFEATIGSAEAWLMIANQVALAQDRRSLIRPGYYESN